MIEAFSQIVAIDPGHQGNAFFLVNGIPVEHSATTHFAGHICVNVCLMAEKNKVRQLIYSNPGNADI